MALRNVKKRTKIIQVGDKVTVKSNGKIIAKGMEITQIDVEFLSFSCKTTATLWT